MTDSSDQTETAALAEAQKKLDEFLSQITAQLQQAQDAAAANPNYQRLPDCYVAESARTLRRDALAPVEVANMICGFIPSKQYGLAGHKKADQAVRYFEILVRDCLAAC